MTDTASVLPAEALLERARQFDRSGQALQAESLCLRVLDQVPGYPAAALMAARFATSRRDLKRAVALLQRAFDLHPGETELAIQLSLALAASGNLPAALVPLEHAVSHAPGSHHAWLILSLVRDRLGDGPAALRAAYQAVTRAQRAGQWLDESSTPPELLAPVVQAIERVRRGRRDLFLGSFAELRAQHGNDALKRMDRALAGYLKEIDVAPPDARQRPLFFYFPDLPSPPYHDPALQPWSRRLAAAFPQIREEALMVLQEDSRSLPDFIPAKSAASPGQYLGGAAARPTWQAFFFYRHGRRFDDNHARCPATSSVLESLDLCRIAEQAPEICFSVLSPQTHIKPHYGVTNTRLVMHLPLIVPRNCALNLIDAGIHEWVEGELVMFDDTFLHESWNRSDSTRVIVLMDCWNPHLTAVERQACTRLIEMISSLKPRGAQTAGADGP
jgi:aspartate beta-hydroxylase